jgi:hypothetical protein
LLAHVPPLLAVVGEETRNEANRPRKEFCEHLQWTLVLVDVERRRILTLPAHSVSHTIMSHMENQTSSTPPTLASGKANNPTNNGMRIRSTMGVMYVKYLTSHEELWTFLKNLEKLVVGFSGGV